MTDQPPALRGILVVLKHALARIRDGDGDWQGTIDELERAIIRIERYLNA